jgi:GT2 family glycosyltransferase
MYKVSIITVNYNTSDHTINLVDNIKDYLSDSVQIIIVDNNSDSIEYGKLERIKEMKHALVIRSRINYGFAGGNMLGVQYASGHYYFFLNNDTEPKGNCIKTLTEFMELRPDVGMCSPMFVNERGEPLPSFDYFPDLSSKIFGTMVFKLTRRSYHPRKTIPKRPIPVDVLSGSQIFIRSELFDQIGGFDLNFFLYCEEEDLAKRVALAGYSAYLVPEALNYHVGGASTKKSLEIENEFLISFFYFYRKHYGSVAQLALRLVYFLRYARKVVRGRAHASLLKTILSPTLGRSMRHNQKLGPPDSAKNHVISIARS